ncbi:MAG: hypothetical protein QOF18_364 [Frankiaceae bacterium]|nr:hypothetical protein [Frankiaceae bacterium]
MTDRLEHPDDLSAMAAEDALLDALANGRSGSDDDALAGLFSAWVLELDTAVAASTTASPLVPRQRWSRARRGAAGLLAGVVVLGASTGVAAAAGGSHGPLGGLYKLVFGGGSAINKTSDVDMVAVRVGTLLQGIKVDVAAATAAGGVSPAQRAKLNARLDSAASMLLADPSPPLALRDQLASLRTTVAGLPALSSGGTQPSGTGTSGGSGSGGSGGTSGSGSGGSGGGSGSDDGTSGGSGGSGSGTGDGSRPSGGGGSDDGSSGSGTSGSGSDGSGDGTSSSGGDGSGDSTTSSGSDGSGDSTSSSGSDGSDGSGSSSGSASLTSSSGDGSDETPAGVGTGD